MVYNEKRKTFFSGFMKSPTVEKKQLDTQKHPQISYHQN